MRLAQVLKEHHLVIEAEDYELLKDLTVAWEIMVSPHTGPLVIGVDSQGNVEPLANYILPVSYDEYIVHKNGNSMDVRKENLRIVSEEGLRV